MTGNEFQQHALRTMNEPNMPYGDLLIGALGLAGEAGEVCDHIKKFIGQGHELDREHVKEELGDVLWYVAITATAIGATLDDVMSTNVLKLIRRYPNGFEMERSVNRDDA